MPLKAIDARRYSRVGIVCDQCGRRITHVEHGRYTWAEDGAIRFVHKGCRAHFERSNPGSWSVMPLEWLRLHVAHNRKPNPKLIREVSALADEVRRLAALREAAAVAATS